MSEMSGMKGLCEKCKYYDANKVEHNIFHCPKINQSIWYDIDVYAGCGGFEEKERAIMNEVTVQGLLLSVLMGLLLGIALIMLCESGLVT